MAVPSFLTVGEQVAAMRAAYPLLRLTAEAGWGAVWQGPLIGLDRPYIVQVAYWQGVVLGGCDLANYGPEVHVLHPDLPAECGGTPLPHTYSSPRHPKLCLFDPDSDDWNHGMPLAGTIVPWAAEWCAFYEFWRVTGRWTGSERHPEPRPVPAGGTGHDVAVEHRLPSPQQAERVGRLLGTEASRPLLGAAVKRVPPSMAFDWWLAYRDCGRFPPASIMGGTA